MENFLAISSLIILLIFLANAIKVVKEYDRLVVFRLGRLERVSGPGIIIVIPIIETSSRISIRTTALDVPSQDVITKDNVSIKVNAVIYFRVIEPAKALVKIDDYMYGTSQLAQTTLRSVVGEFELDDILSEREKINERLQSILDKSTDSWGIKVSLVELKHVDLPENMQKAMARQAEAERERRAKIIAAEGEFQAAAKLSEAAEAIGKHPVTLQLRYLQTLSEIAGENNSTTIFPIPIDLVKPFMNLASNIADTKQNLQSK